MESSVLGPQGWWQGQRGTCASAEDEGHLLVPSCQVNPHLGIPTALPQSPNPHGDRVPSAHDTRHFVYPASDSKNSLEPELLQENHRFKVLGTAIIYFFFSLQNTFSQQKNNPLCIPSWLLLSPPASRNAKFLR